MPPVHDEAICIRQWDWSETSQTVSLFCRGLGVVRALAKGSRRPKTPYSGGIEVLTRGLIGVIARPSNELALMTEWDLVEQFGSLRRSLKAHYAGLYMAELVLHSVHDHDPHAPLYDALLNGLRSLEDEALIHLALLNFQWAVLVETGYRPQLAMDVRSGAALAPARSYRFSPALGGLLVDEDTSPETVSTWRVRAETVELLRSLPIDPSGLDVRGDAAGGVLRAGRLLAAYIRYVLGREPRMLPYLYDRHLPR